MSRGDQRQRDREKNLKKHGSKQNEQRVRNHVQRISRPYSSNLRLFHS